MKFSADAKILESDDLAAVAWEAIAPIWDDLPYQRYAALETFMADLTRGQQGLIAIDWCQKEVRNGGFAQLLGNATGNLVPWAIRGLRMIEATKYASLVAEAASLLGPDYPTSAAARRRALRCLTETARSRMAQLDGRFLDLIASVDEDLELYRGRYVRTHPGEFVRG